jgi:polyprenyl-phospho-N-acetylgalactosaminyl synthase
VTEFRPCAIVPTYDNPRTIEGVVRRLHQFLPDVVVVDDGSHEAGRDAVQRLAADGLAHAHRRARNGGKGAAVKDGLRVALSLGYSHGLQIDADGQHALEDVPRFLEISRRRPEALVLGCPIFDASVPRSRRLGRRITTFWSAVETAGRVITDPMCGFRVYPLATAVRAGARGNRMDFDPEIAVRLVWAGVPIENVPTLVRYLPASAGGVSHFRMFRDNVAISWMHTRLVTLAIAGWLFGRRRTGAP